MTLTPCCSSGPWTCSPAGPRRSTAAGGDTALGHLQLFLQGDEPVASLRRLALPGSVRSQRHEPYRTSARGHGHHRNAHLPGRPSPRSSRIRGLHPGSVIFAVVIVILLLVSIPLFVFYRDVRRTLV